MNNREGLIRIVLLCLLLYSAVSLASAGGELRQVRARQETLRARLEAAEGEMRALQAELEKELSPETAEQLARQRLGLVRPGEKIFYFTTDREESPWNWQQATSTRAR